jgi:hypothetical protein
MQHYVPKRCCVEADSALAAAAPHQGDSCACLATAVDVYPKPPNIKTPTMAAAAAVVERHNAVSAHAQSQP